MALYIRRRPQTVVVQAHPGPAPGAPLQEAVPVTGSTAPPPATPPQPTPEAASVPPAAPDQVVGILAGALLVIAIGAGTLLYNLEGGPTYSPEQAAVGGFAAFALFYVIAQAAERAAEIVLGVCTRWGPLNKPRAVELRDKALVAAHTGVTQSEELKALGADLAAAVAGAQGEVDRSVLNRRWFTFAVTALLGTLACAYLEAGFLTVLGVGFAGEDADSSSAWTWWACAQMTVTALVVGGGSAALHATITTLTKKAEQKENPPETGGTAGPTA